MQDELWRALLGYLPGYLLKQAALHPSLGRWERRDPGVVLVADISGFTPLAEALTQAGRRGDEELSGILNYHFSTMVELVRAQGGDTVQFSGDAITALFAPREDEGDLCPATLRALACARAIQRHTEGSAVLPTSQGEFTLHVRIGIGAGPVYVAVVGDETIGLLHLLAGPGRAGAVQAQGLARPGQIILSPGAYRLVADTIACRPARWGYAQVEDTLLPLQQDLESRATQDTPPPQHLSNLATFLPPVLYRRLETAGWDFCGEHRRIVVLFTGFQGLDFARDQAVGEKLRTYTAAAQRIIHKYDGWLNEIEMGDKGSLLVVLFGAPSSHEDDEERALLCALEMQEQLRQLKSFHIGDQRIGISAGTLFVGPIGSLDRWTYTAVGDEMNLAARLMERADWGQVVTSARLRYTAQHQGRFHPLGQIKVKGKALPVPLFEVTGIHRRSSALTVRWQMFPGETIGRAKEFAHIQEIAGRALDGDAQILLLEGEAGVGKSRLTGEMVHWWLEQGEQGYGGDCLSYTEGTPYRPWGTLLAALLELPTQTPPDKRLDLLKERLETIGQDLAARSPLLSDVLGWPIPDNEFTHHLQGSDRQKSLFRTILDILRHQAGRGPTLLLFEDIHWIDHPSLELVEFIARNLPGHPILLVLVHRPLDEPRPAPYRDLSQLSYCHVISLEALSDAGSEALARSRLRLPPTTALPDELKALFKRAQGNPFFIEEIIHTLEDAGVRVVPHNGDCQVYGDLAAVKIPQIVQDLVQSRIDQLDEGSQLTLKVASVIGRTVPYTTLRGIYPRPISQESLNHYLSTLERVNLFLLERPEPEQTFFFKHIITREVAYESLLFAQRQALHQSLGQYLEQAHANDLDPVVDQLAHHYHLGGERTKAFSYLMRAGERASQAHSNLEALAYYRQAHNWLEADDPNKRWDYLQHLEQVLRALSQWEEQQQVLYEMEQLAEALGQDRRLAYVRHRQGALLVVTGRPAEGIPLLQKAIRLAQEGGDIALAGRCAIDISRAHWLQWDLGQSQEALEQARQFFRQAGDPEGEAATLNMLGNIYLAIITQYERALQMFRQCTAIYHSLGMAQAEASGWINEAIALLSLGASELALEKIRPAQTFFERSGDVLMQGLAWFTTAHAHMQQERIPKALEAAQRCLQLLETAQEHNFLIEGEGLIGRILLQMDRPEEALDHFRRACQLADAGGQEVDAAHFGSFEALTLLRLGQAQSALERSNQIITFLESHGGRVDNLQHIYFHHFLILRQVQGEEAGRPYLQRAHQLLQELTADIQDPDLRQSFLKGQRGNREIIAAWRTAQHEF